MYTHPPLFLFSVRFMEFFQNSVFAMRIPFALAGAAIPLVVYAWLKRYYGVAAAWIALFILLMAPNVFFLGWQVRGYIYALLGMAVAVCCLERALEHRSIRWLALSFCGLYWALLAEYMAVWFLAAIGGHSLLVLWRESPGRRFTAAWIAGQTGAAAILAWLQSIRTHQPGLLRIGSIGRPRDYLPDQYLGPDQNPLLFFADRTLGVFEYAFSSGFVGAIALAVFLAGLIRLGAWKHLAGIRARILPVLLVLPFLLAGAAAMMGIYPYGGTRHSIHLAFYIAAGIGIALEPLFRRRLAVLIAILGVLTPAWYLNGATEPAAITHRHLKRHWVTAAFEYLRETVPPDVAILTDRESLQMVSYYLDPHAPFPRGIDGNAEKVGGHTFYAPRWIFERVTDIGQDAADLRRHYGIDDKQHVWVLDTGLDCAMCRAVHAHPSLVDKTLSLRRFGPAAAVFQMLPGSLAPLRAEVTASASSD